ncbi:MAG: hypothetical protein HFJ34_00220 [Clostridia bacterium]|nr:hypothetical protein [Clostridia bacterium]
MVTDLIQKEENQASNRKIPKEVSQEILKKIVRNLLEAIGIMFYFILLNLAYLNMKQERLVGDIKVFAGAFLVIGMLFLEKSYKKDNGSLAITGIEFLFLSLHSLSIMHVITLFKYDFRFYLLTSSYLFSIYYVLKAIILYTKERKEYLNSLSDISEIVKKEEPIKREAKKRKEELEEEEDKMQLEMIGQNEKEIKQEKQEDFEKTKQEEKAKRKKKNVKKRGKKK